jgi:hypothetical protein
MYDFDFLVGEWSVGHRRLKERLAGSEDWDEFTGTARCWQVFGGAANIDEIVAPERGLAGMSVRLYDSAERKWRIHWADSRTGSLDPGVSGRFADDVGTFDGEDICDGKPVAVRYVWSEMTGTSARWEQAFSADGGLTWETNWIMTFIRR